MRSCHSNEGLYETLQMICIYVTNTKKHTKILVAQSFVAMYYENILINTIYLSFEKQMYLRYGIMCTIALYPLSLMNICVQIHNIDEYNERMQFAQTNIECVLVFLAEPNIFLQICIHIQTITIISPKSPPLSSSQSKWLFVSDT